MCNTEKSFKIILVVCFIGFAINLVSFILIINNYRKSTNSLYYFEENYPDINFTGIRNFDFKMKISGDIQQEFLPSSPNLGNTGKLIFDCYNGLCKYTEEYSCGTDKSKCYERKYYSRLTCSRECRTSNANKCNLNHCYNAYTTMCSHEKDTEEYSDEKSCYADNIIYIWENYYYVSTNATKSSRQYSYLNNAVPSEESCPSGKKMCGILDNLGNKLCIDNSENCPINYITLDKSNLHYTFNKTTIDNLTIYYTNEATETGKVVGGLFVDSDLLIKYNNEDCVTLATSTISSLLNSQNNKLYRNSLNFDPYKENIDLKGKSYLKWCVPGHGKEKSISKIRKLNDDYTYNISMNKDVIPYLKDFRFLIFGSLPGFIDEFLVILISCYLFYRKTNLNNENKKAFVERIIERIFLIVMAFTIFILFIGLILYFYDSTLSKLSIANKPEQNNPFKTIKTNYTVCIWLNIALIVFNCVLLCYNNCYLNKKNQNNSNNINYNYNGNNAANNNNEGNAQLL